MKDLAFIIPYRSDNGYRDKIFDWILKRYSVLFPNSKVYISDSDPSKKFNRSQARNNAFKLSKEKYVAFCDADTFWSPSIVFNALPNLSACNWIIPYNKYYITQPVSSVKILDSSVNIEFISSEYSYDIIVQSHPYDILMPPISGIQLFESDKFWLTGGFDERYDGWGYEDNAFVFTANNKIGQYSRLDGSICHIWHPPSHDANIDGPQVINNRNYYHTYLSDFNNLHKNFL